MDQFEKEYFEKLRSITLYFEGKRRELAKSRIKMFAAAVVRQVLDEKQKFDLIIGAGNSGLFMTKLTHLTYETLNLDSPEIINIPITRIFEENKEVKVLTGDFEIRTDKKIRNVLFVDDEIMRAVTARTVFELLLEQYTEIDHLDATIIAENHFFEWHYNLPKVSVRFFAYSRLIQWLNGNIGHFVPGKLFYEIQSVIPEVQSYNHVMAIVLGGGLKKQENGKPYFDEKIEKILEENIKDYKIQKENLENELKNLIKEGVEEYKEEKITFRF